MTSSVRKSPVEMAEQANRREIVERLVQRDQSALAELYDRTSSRAFGLAYRVLNDSAAAEDAVQDAFTWLWDNPGRLDPERGSIDSLVMTIVHRRSIDAVRARTRRSAIGSDAVRQRLAIETGDAATEAEAAIDAETVSRLVSELPGEQRSAIDMAYFQGMTHTEIADASGIALGTVKSRLRLAMNTLRKSFGIGGTS